MEPVGRILWNDPADLKAFRLRHLEYYNGNPFMVPLVLGAVARMEERLLSGDGMKIDDISQFKKAVSQASGAVGDRFFWRTLRPFGLVLGLLAAIFYGLWGVFVFLALFNIPTMLLKWYWLTQGYKLGPKVVIELQNQYIARAAHTMENTGGIILSFLAVAFLSRQEYEISWISAGTIGIFILTITLLKRKISHSIVFPIAVCVAIIFGIIIDMFP